MIRTLLNGYGRFDARKHMGPACWEHFDLILILSGRIRVELLDAQEVVLGDDEALLIFPETPFHGESLTSVTEAAVQHFDVSETGGSLPSVCRRLLGKRGGFELYPDRQGKAAAPHIHRALRLSSEEPCETIDDMKVATLTLALGQLRLTSRSGEERTEAGARFEPLLDWLEERLDQSVTVEEMASFLGWSASHFRALFHGAMGTSPGSFFREMKLRQARRLLRETVLPIKEIARAVGYAELPHFYRIFRKRYGTTPGRYRERHEVVG